MFHLRNIFANAKFYPLFTLIFPFKITQAGLKKIIYYLFTDVLSPKEKERKCSETSWKMSPKSQIIYCHEPAELKFPSFQDSVIISLNQDHFVYKNGEIDVEICAREISSFQPNYI